MTLGEAAELHLARVRIERSKNSQHTYRWTVGVILSWFGETRQIGDIDRKLVQSWINEMKAQDKRSPSTIRALVSGLSVLFSLAVEEGEEVDWCGKWVRLPKVNNKKDRILTTDEEAQIRKIMGPIDFSLVTFAINTGMRRLEQFSLRKGDISFMPPQPGGLETAVARIATSKTGLGRVCCLNSVAANVARLWIETFPEAEYLFYPQNKARSRLFTGTWFDHARWRPALEKANLVETGLTWHSLRHTCASRAIMAGASMDSVSRHLGHSTVKMTERYAHYSGQDWNAARALGGV